MAYDPEGLRARVGKGAGVTVVSNNGWTPLNFAANNGHVDVVRLLLEKGADIESKDNDHSQMPLAWAEKLSVARSKILQVVCRMA